MKRVFTLYFFILIALSAFAVPAYPDLITFRQPGMDFSVNIFLKGDERVHWAETEDERGPGVHLGPEAPVPHPSRLQFCVKWAPAEGVLIRRDKGWGVCPWKPRTRGKKLCVCLWKFLGVRGTGARGGAGPPAGRGASLPGGDQGEQTGRGPWGPSGLRASARPPGLGGLWC